jgi:hypothetical protein
LKDTEPATRPQQERKTREPGFAEPAAEAEAHRDWLPAGIALALLAIAFFNPIFRADATFSDVAAHQTAIYPWHAYPSPYTDSYPQSDQADTFYPWQVFINDSLQSGELPEWNPYSFAGAPFVTNGQSGVLYPPKVILSLLFSPSWVHDLFLLLHVFASGFAMFVLMKDLRVRSLPALLSGSAWMFSSFTFAWIQLEHIVVVAAYLPAALLFARRAVVGRSPPAAVAAGLALGLCLVGGNVALVTLVFAVVFSYLVALIAMETLRRRSGFVPSRALIRNGLLVAVAALGSSAALVIPGLFVLGELGRQQEPYAAIRDIFAVDFRTFVNSWREPPLPLTAENMHEMTFVGTAVALLAVIGAASRRPGAWLGGLLALTTLLVAIGTPLTWFAYHLIPGFEYFRPLGRGLFLWCFAVALLGGLGLDVVVRWLRRPRFRLADYFSPGASARLEAYTFRGTATAVAAAIVLFTLWQLIPLGRDLNPPFQPRDSEYLYPETPSLASLQRSESASFDREPQRILPLRRSVTGDSFTPPVLYASHAMVFGLESAAGYESVVPERTAAIWRLVAGEPIESVLSTKIASAYIPSFFTDQTRFDLLPRLGITTLYAPPDIDDDPTWKPSRYRPLRLEESYRGIDGVVYDLPGAQPRAYVVYRATLADGSDDALRTFASPGFDFRRTAIFERRDSEELERQARGEAGTGPAARALELEGDAERYEVESDRPGWLVVSSMWDSGWDARVNGDDEPVLRANYNLRAVRIPVGRSIVELEYTPTGFHAGLALTAGTLLIPAGFFLLRRRGRRAAQRLARWRSRRATPSGEPTS